MTVRIISHSPERSRDIGEIIGGNLEPGRGVLLTGELGAGKTTLIGGICQALGVDSPVKSPTFVLCWQYQGRDALVHHIDLYRLGDVDELVNIGWEEMSDSASVYLVEWADRFEIPGTNNAVGVHLEYGENIHSRHIAVMFEPAEYPRLERELLEYENSGN